MRGTTFVIHYARPCAQDIGLDVAYALRGLRRRPAFACIAIAILAVAPGSNTAMFAVVHQILIAGLALGATPAAVAVQVTMEAWKSLAVGVIVGGLIAAAAGRYAPRSCLASRRWTW